MLKYNKKLKKHLNIYIPGSAVGGEKNINQNPKKKSGNSK